MGIKVTTATGPSHWACYFINGDAGDMSDRELKEADKWCDSQQPWYVVAVVEDSERFTNLYDVHNPYSQSKGGNVCDYVLHRQTRKYTRKPATT
jgi:hypothetical protein